MELKELLAKLAKKKITIKDILKELERQKKIEYYAKLFNWKD